MDEPLFTSPAKLSFSSHVQRSKGVFTLSSQVEQSLNQALWQEKLPDRIPLVTKTDGGKYLKLEGGDVQPPSQTPASQRTQEGLGHLTKDQGSSQSQRLPQKSGVWSHSLEGGRREEGQATYPRGQGGRGAPRWL